MPWFGRTAAACAAPSAPLPGVVSERMRRFARMNSFKREARRVVAGLMRREEVAGLVAQVRRLWGCGARGQGHAQLASSGLRGEVAPVRTPRQQRRHSCFSPDPWSCIWTRSHGVAVPGAGCERRRQAEHPGAQGGRQGGRGRGAGAGGEEDGRGAAEWLWAVDTWYRAQGMRVCRQGLWVLCEAGSPGGCPAPAVCLLCAPPGPPPAARRRAWPSRSCGWAAPPPGRSRSGRWSSCWPGGWRQGAGRGRVPGWG